MKTKLTSLTALLFTAALTPLAADAGMIETFSFTQTGYLSGSGLSGTFTGAPEADGSIQLADLTAFSAAFTADLGQLNGPEADTYALPDLQFFSLLPSTNGPNSSLDLFAGVTTGTPGSICVGAAAAFGLCGQSGNITGVDHLRYPQNPFLFETTAQIATVQLVPAAAVPEPSYLGLCGFVLSIAMIRSLGNSVANQPPYPPEQVP